jgi:hypothetical protein
MRTLLLVLATLVVVAPRGLSAQGLRGVGLLVGDVESRQTRPREDDSGSRNGIVAGAFVDVRISGPWSVLAEAAYAQRGGRYPDEPGGGEVEADYLDMTVAPEWHLDIGFVGAFVYGGPTGEFSLRTRYSPNLASAYQNPAGQVLSATAGAGVELRIPAIYAFRLEIRHVEGLSPAFTGDAGDFKHRSTEILVRVGRHGP